MDERKSLPAETETIASLHTRAQRKVSSHQRLLETLTDRVGRPPTLYVLAAVTVGWIAWNAFTNSPLDRPPFGWLQTGLAIYAAALTTIVVITQNRQGRHEEERAYLDLQVNLLVERKTTKIVELLEELRRDLPNVRDRRDPLAEKMARSIDAHAAVDAIEAALEKVEE